MRAGDYVDRLPCERCMASADSVVYGDAFGRCNVQLQRLNGAYSIARKSWLS